ncbi:hypothetical protein KQX54_004920 [Cotesia glomerata]|uniref:Uncharacterized protein n=1 Tax=Cotesia glomerata TaxID=32391 RepID=A0AAV7HXF1_COTGL|nr:hypothetical protein KQX54_004920 [Cotesia glomerata]
MRCGLSIELPLDSRTRIVLGTIAAVMAAVVVEIQHSPPNSVRVMKILCYKRHLLYVLLCTDWQCIARHWESVYQLSQSIKINHDTVPPSALSPLSLPLEHYKAHIYVQPETAKGVCSSRGAE